MRSTSNSCHLRLVAYAPVVSPGLLAATPALRLQSYQPGKDSARLSALAPLFDALTLGERLELTHRVSACSTGRQRYSFTVEIAACPARLDQLTMLARAALGSAFAHYCFASPAIAGGAVDAGAPSALQFCELVTLAGLKARPRLAAAHSTSRPLDRPTWLQDDRPCQADLPFPGDLPSWPLTEPLVELPAPPSELEIRVVLQAFELSDAEQTTLARTLQHIDAGTVALYHPESPITPHSQANELCGAALDVGRHWLRQPRGVSVQCEVRSSSALDEVTLARIARDVFGKMPTCIRALPTAQALPCKPQLAHAVHLTQGMPALLPGLGALPLLGIARHYAPPINTPPTMGAYIGESVCGYRSSAVHVPHESRTRHSLIIGSSGSGKSTLMLQLLLQDINDPQLRAGVALLDCHGDLTARVLSSIAPNRHRDVILMDVDDLQGCVSFNPLEGMKGNAVRTSFVSSEFVALVDLLFEESNSTGPTMRSNLKALIALCAWVPNRDGSFLDAMRFLEEPDYLDYVLSKCADRELKAHFAKQKGSRSSETGWDAWVPFLQSRLSPFTVNPLMKRLICMPSSTFDINDAMNNKKIVIFRLSKSHLQETEVRILGALISMRFFAAALGRASVPEALRVPFNLYMDEFQNFATDTFPTMLSEARKYGLSINVACQNIGQIKSAGKRTSIVDSLLANTATRFMFRLGPSDLEVLAPYYKPVFDEGLMATLPDFTAVACLHNHNTPLSAVAVRIVPPTAVELDTARIERVVASSRLQFSRPIHAVNHQLCETFELSKDCLTGSM